MVFGSGNTAKGGMIKGVCAAFLISALSSTIYSSAANAGGFSIREQSTSGLGAAFAGNAAGYDLSTIYWNPAGVATAGVGVTTESHYALILPNSRIDPVDGQPTAALLGAFFGYDTNPTNIEEVAIVPASYGAYRINDKLTLGFGINSPFGLSTKSDNPNYLDQFSYRSADLLTMNLNPVIGYQVSDTLSIGVGFQAQYTDLELNQAFLAGVGVDPTAKLQGDDWGYGFTIGAMWKPVAGTTIGIGYRSKIENTLEGDVYVDGIGQFANIEADLDLPDILTISLRQDLSPNMRLLGTFEWTNWSILQTVKVQDTGTGSQLLFPGVGGAAPVQIEANWDDGYFLSGGLEYDYNSQLTLRGGVAYEWSPVQEPTQRLSTIPDADRIWLSVGATYKWNEMTSFDIGYTHIFIEDSDILRPNSFAASVESSVDIIGVSMKTKWGADGPLGILKGFNN